MGATDLADVILEKRAIDYKTAHRIVGEAVKRAMAAGVQTLDAEMLEAAAEAVLGKKLDLDAETIASAMEPASIVETRAGTGGASEATVMEMISACRGTVSEHEDWRNAVESKLDEAEARLVDRATGLRREPSPRVANEANEQAAPPPSREGRGEASNDLLKEFEGLPKMPHWRRRRWES